MRDAKPELVHTLVCDNHTLIQAQLYSYISTSCSGSKSKVAQDSSLFRLAKRQHDTAYSALIKVKSSISYLHCLRCLFGRLSSFLVCRLRWTGNDRMTQRLAHLPMESGN